MYGKYSCVTVNTQGFTLARIKKKEIVVIHHLTTSYVIGVAE